MEGDAEGTPLRYSQKGGRLGSQAVNQRGKWHWIFGAHRHLSFPARGRLWRSGKPERIM